MRYSLRGLLLLVTLCAVVLGGRQLYIRWRVSTEIENLKNARDPPERARAAFALGQMGPAARAAVPHLIEALLQESAGDWPMDLLGQPIPHSLANIGPAAIPDVCKAISDPAQRARGWGVFPPTWQSTGKPLIFTAAQDFVARGGPESQPVVEALHAIESDRCSYVTSWAAETLDPQTRKRSSRASSAPANHPAGAAMAEERSTIIAEVHRKYREQHPMFEKQIEAWTGQLQSPEAIERAWGAHMLGEFAGDRYIYELEYNEEIKALAGALADEDARVRHEAGCALDRISSCMHRNAKQAVPALVDALVELEAAAPWWGQGERFFCQRLLSALSSIGRGAQPAVPVLVELLHKPMMDSMVRSNLASTLGRIGPAAKVAVPTLIELVQYDKDSSVRGSAAEALGEIGRDASVAVPALIEALQDKSVTGISSTAGGDKENTVSEAAARALTKIDPDSAAKAGVKLSPETP